MKKIILPLCAALFLTPIANGCDAPALQAVTRMVKRWNRHSPVIAEEMLKNYASNNESPIEIEDENFEKIDLAKYKVDGDLDWNAIERDFPGTQTTFEVSRPGCDSTGTFGMAWLHCYDRERIPSTNSFIMELTKRPNGEWKTGIGITTDHNAFLKWTREIHSANESPDYATLCSRFVHAPESATGLVESGKVLREAKP